MPNSKYAVMSCPSSKLDKVCIVCKATEKKKPKTKHFTGRRTSQIGSVVTSFVLFCFVLFFVSGGKNPDPKKSQLGFFAAKFLGKYFELFSKTFSQFFFFLKILVRKQLIFKKLKEKFSQNQREKKKKGGVSLTHKTGFFPNRLLHLNSTLPLWKIYCKTLTEGVLTVRGLAH